MKKLLALAIVLVLALTSVCALAESITFDGTVVCENTVPAVAPIGGTLDSVTAKSGARVNAGDVLATLSTDVTYAKENGTVYFFGSVGDDAALVSSRYGAVAYVEPEYQYTIKASTSTAPTVEANRIIHPGEAVYLRGYTNITHTGEGIVTSVSGSNYVIEVHSGNFTTGETVSVFRDAAYNYSSSLGRGNIAHVDPVAYTAQGSIALYSVENGSSVKKGDPLFETLNGVFEGYKLTGTAITAPESGVICQVSASENSTVSKGTPVCMLYPDSGMRIRCYVSEYNLRYLDEGTEVIVAFPYLRDARTANGKVSAISYLADGVSADAGSEEAWYTVYITFDSFDAVRYGMSAVITTCESEAQE